MGKALYGVYFIVAIGAGAFALLLFNSNQAVTSKTMECARLVGAEQNKCMKQAAEMAKLNAAIAKPFVGEPGAAGEK